MAIISMASGIITYDFLQNALVSSTSSSQTGRYCVEGMYLNNTNEFYGLEFAARADLWVSLAHKFGTNALANAVVMEFRSGTVGVLRVIHGYGVTHADGFQAVKLQAWDGATWVDLADSSAVGGLRRDGENTPIIAHAVLGDAGSFLLKQGDLTLIDYSGDTLRGAQTTFDMVVFSGLSNAIMTNLQWAILADEDPTGFIVAEQVLTGDGALTEWDGGAAQVDELVGSNGDVTTVDGDIMAGESAGLDATFLKSALHGDLQHGYEIKAVSEVARARKNGSAPDLRFLSRHGSTNYAGSTIVPGPSFEAVREVRNLNPATGATWTAAEVNAREFGVRTV